MKTLMSFSAIKKEGYVLLQRCSADEFLELKNLEHILLSNPLSQSNCPKTNFAKIDPE